MAEEAPTQRIDAPPPSGPPAQPRGATVVDAPSLAPPPAAPPPASPVAADPLAAASAGFGQRGKLRRRLRRMRNARAVELVKLGTLVLDARRRTNGSQPEVVTRRAAEVAELDRQVRELQHAVDPHADARVVSSGIAGTCKECGELVATDDRFCAQCGTTLTRRPRRAPSPEGGVQENGSPAAEIVHTPAPLPPPVPGAVQAPPPVPGTAQTPTKPPAP